VNILPKLLTLTIVAEMVILQSVCPNACFVYDFVPCCFFVMYNLKGESKTNVTTSFLLALRLVLFSSPSN